MSCSEVKNETKLSEPDTENFYNRLLNEAPYIPGDIMELIPASDIPWADRSLMTSGIKFMLANFFPIALINTAALLLGFSVKPNSAVLVRTGKFNTPKTSFLRYVSTARRLLTWFTSDICDAKSEGFKEIRNIRKLHSHYAKSRIPLPTPKELNINVDKSKLTKAIVEDMQCINFPDAPRHLLTWDPPLPFSQFDMAMTQFAFFGIIKLFPERIGFGEKDLEGIEAYTHFWAVVGRMMGLEDRFNLALHADKNLLLKLYNNIGLASIKESDDSVICLQCSLLEGIHGFEVKGWVYYWLKEYVPKFEGKSLLRLMSWGDKFYAKALKFTIFMYRKSEIARFFINGFVVLVAYFFFGVRLPTQKICPFA